MKKVIALLLALVMVLGLAACGGDTSTTKTETDQDTTASTDTADTSADADTTDDAAETGDETGDTAVAVPERIVVVLPNVRGDGGTHDLACRASEAIAAESGAELKIVELGKAVTDAAKWEAAMLDLCDEGYDLVITGGSLMKDTIELVAPQYPEIPFICYDVALDFDTFDMPNVYSMDFYQNEAAYLAGVIAAKTSTTGKLGFIGATKIPVIYDFMVGFIAGAQAVNPDIQVATAFTNDYNDAALAKELSLAQVTAGADVLFPSCGNAAAGTYEVARDEGVYAIGNDQDVNAKYETTDPDIAAAILASVMKKVDNAVTTAYNRYLEGTLPFGTQETVGVATDGAGVVKNAAYDALPQEVKDTVADFEAKIASGEVVVPTAIGMSAEEIDAIIASAQ